MPLNVLVVGAGVCGPAFAAMLQAFDHRHQITVIERSPALRSTGQQIDLKTAVIPIIEKLSITDLIKSHSIAEKGFEIVDTNGKTVLHFDFDEDDDKRNDFSRSVASEYEIMRGDLVSVFYKFSLAQRDQLSSAEQKEGSLTYEFGKTITELVQLADGVDVTFSNGQKGRYDLVVGADGQGSQTRRSAFGQKVSDESYKSLQIHAAFYSIPRIEGEGENGKAYLAPGRRGIMTRTGDRPKTQVFLFSMNNAERLKEVSREPVHVQKKVWADTFKNAGWQSARFRAELNNTDDFYTCELAQIKMQQWYKGSVVLVGDAGYSPSVMTGMGTTASLVGAYVLAGELSKPGQDLKAALRSYDGTMRPFVTELQKIPGGGLMGPAWPSSRLAIWLLTRGLWAISTFGIDSMVKRLMPRDSKPAPWTLPEYPKMHVR